MLFPAGSVSPIVVEDQWTQPPTKERKAELRDLGHWTGYTFFLRAETEGGTAAVASAGQSSSGFIPSTATSSMDPDSVWKDDAWADPPSTEAENAELLEVINRWNSQRRAAGQREITLEEVDRLDPDRLTRHALGLPNPPTDAPAERRGYSRGSIADRGRIALTRNDNNESESDFELIGP